jgi:uncharacterized membrane protein
MNNETTRVWLFPFPCWCNYHKLLLTQLSPTSYYLGYQIIETFTHTYLDAITNITVLLIWYVDIVLISSADSMSDMNFWYYDSNNH